MAHENARGPSRSASFIPALVLLASGSACSNGKLIDPPPGPEPDPIEPKPEPSRPLECGFTPLDKVALCGGAASCPIRTALTFGCKGNSIEGFDLAVTPTRAFFVPTANAGRSFLVDVPLAGQPQQSTLGDAHVGLVAAGPEGDDDPRVLLSSYPDQHRVLRRAPGGWSAESVTARAVPYDFAVNRAGQQFILMVEQVASGYVTRVVRLPPGEGDSVTVTQESVGQLQMRVDAEGRPVVTYLAPTQNVIVRRWSAGTTADIFDLEEPPYRLALGQFPDGRPILALARQGGLYTLGEGVAETAVFKAAPWTEPRCGGGSIASYPAICSAPPREVKAVGEQASPSSSAIATSPRGDVFVATLTGDVTVGCQTGGSCIETMTCHCSENSFASFTSRLKLRIWRLGAKPWELVLTPPELGVDSRIVLDASDVDHLYIAWKAYSQANLAVIDLPGL